MGSSSEDQPQIVDLFNLGMELKIRNSGKLYKRKIEPIRGAEKVTEGQTVETFLSNGVQESVVDAKPGDWIITGAEGEKFVFTAKKFIDLYISDGQGGYLPKNRKVMALKNPFGKQIKIVAPWSTKESPAYQEGDEHCFVVASLDDLGDFTGDRYLIGNEELLLSNYRLDDNQREINPNKLCKLLDQALQYGTIEDLEGLFNEGMDINQTDFEGRTALQMMSAKGNKKAVEMLLVRGANVNMIFMYHGSVSKTALDAATETRRNEIVDLLIANGAKTGEELSGTN